MLRREPGIAAASGRYQLLCQHCGIQTLDSVKCCGWVSITPQRKLATSTVNI